MKLLKITSLLLILCFSGTSFAKLTENDLRDYESDYYGNAGFLIFKLKPHYANTRAKQKDFKVPPNPTAVRSPSALVQNGYGIDVSTTYFFTDYIAAELSAGVTYFKTKRSSITDVFNNYGNGSAKDVGKKNDVWMLPLTAAVQYHIAPFGAIRPYVGAGIHGTYMYSRASSFNLDNGVGYLVQGGIDFVAKDDTTIGIDIRYLKLESKINYRKEFLNRPSELSPKVKWNPFQVALTFGFIF